jgi:hypothetical protein
MNDLKRTLIIVNTVLLAVLCALTGWNAYMLRDMESKMNAIQTAQSNQSAQPQQTDNGKTEPEPQLIFEDELVKVSFIKWYEDESIDGITYLKLKIDNKSGKELMVYLENTSVNKIMVDSLTGTPNIIPIGGSSEAPYLLNTGTKGITSADAIEELTFKMVIIDNATNEVIKTTEQWRIYKK